MSEELPFKPPEHESVTLDDSVEDSRDTFRRGVVLGFIAHIFLVIVYLVVQSMYATGILALVFFGVAQFLYQVPISIILWRKGLRRMNSGLWMAIGLSFLLNSGIFGLCFAALAIDGFK